ncbi:MAG: GTP cyclohydrolase II [Bryobacterales bacterium]
MSKSAVSARIEAVADASLPTSYGEFRILGFRGFFEGKEYEMIALKMGDLTATEPAPLVRVHSQCMTGEVFGSQRCDCGPQLQMAMRMISEAGNGVLIYDPQEGRGIGLLNKLRAYELQDRGADTVEANEQLGFAADLRNYTLSIAVLEALGVHRVRFLSNNPAKVKALVDAGIEVEERIPCEPSASDRAAAYLQTKKEKMGHLLGGA